MKNNSWNFTETSLALDKIAENEALFTLANGTLGIRGFFEENRCVANSSSFMNGFYEKEPIEYGEHMPSYAEFRQRLTPIPNGSMIELYVDDIPFDMSTGELLQYERHMKLHDGVMHRSLKWCAPNGIIVQLNTWRIVSFFRPNMATFRWHIILNRSARLTIHSRILGIDEKFEAQANVRDPRVASNLDITPLEILGIRRFNDGGEMTVATKLSKIMILCAMFNTLNSKQKYQDTVRTSPNEINHVFQINCLANSPIELHKYLIYKSETINMENSDPHNTHLVAVSDVFSGSSSAISKHQYSYPPFSTLFKEQQKYMRDFWDQNDITIGGDPSSQLILRFIIFHLLQSAGRNGKTSISAKGLTSNGYYGHYFWDAETFVLPFFIYAAPKIARSLLIYRYNTLPEARQRAKEMSIEGALYPWRTINGHEASEYFPAGTAQYHINADIMYTVGKYLKITQDDEFMCDYAFEMYVETARMWISLGDYIDGRGFCINMVTGPDEYTVMVNNNFYTNVMARRNLSDAIKIAATVRKKYPAVFTKKAKELNFTEKEIDRWHHAVEHMFIPYNQKYGLYGQDDAFFDRAQWKYKDDDKNQPLLLRYHPLVLYRYQVLKQPDVVMAMYMLRNQFSLEEKRANFDYYDPLTLNDSSLGPCIRSICANEIGYHDLAWQYFQSALRMDIDDNNNNTRHGLHIASSGGTWMAVIYGFGGLHDDGETIGFRPSLPKHWDSLKFKLAIAQNTLELSITDTETCYTLHGNSPLTIQHYEQSISLTPHTPYTASNRT